MADIMRHQKWAPAYYTKKEILQLDNVALLNAFAQAAEDSAKVTNFRTHYPQKLAKQIEWMREELLVRLKGK